MTQRNNLTSQTDTGETVTRGSSTADNLSTCTARGETVTKGAPDEQPNAAQAATTPSGVGSPLCFSSFSAAAPKNASPEQMATDTKKKLMKGRMDVIQRKYK